MTSIHLAIDLGASSGRAILGVLDSETGPNDVASKRLRLEEVHRFVHLNLPTPTGPVWNLTDIWRNILEGLKKGAAYCDKHDLPLTSVGVDCWGVDWGLLGESGESLLLPHCYRDPRNDAAHERVIEKLGGVDWLYQQTGIQDMSLNTVYQIAARFEQEPEIFRAARHFVFLPDLFHYWLSGQITVERTIASTSSLLNVATRDWDAEILARLGIPEHLFGPIVDPGTDIGRVREEIAAATGVSKKTRVVVPASHDTASAIAAVPANPSADAGDWAYLSSGTWSLLGAELNAPNVSPAAAEVPFTNELGMDSTVRFLKNITGLWMVQELRREANEQSNGTTIEFEQMMLEAKAASALKTLVDPNFADFLKPGNMAGKIKDYARRTNQPAPETLGEQVRCCVESLAICYRDTLTTLEKVLDRSFEKLHVVGGGSKNDLLNQFIADATGRSVVCGPAEATAIGNVMVQAIGCGCVQDLPELRSIVGRSYPPVVVLPKDNSDKLRTVIYPTNQPTSLDLGP